MDTLNILHDSIKPNLIPILEILGVFLITSIVGSIIYSVIFKLKSWFVLLPASGLLGIFGFIFFLGCLSYLFKGSGGILIILILYILFGLSLYIKFKSVLPKIKFSKNNFFWILVSLTFLGVFFLIAGVNIYGGDVIAYWGFATSFANGNYPVMSPWQPELLAAHHQGAFLYQGAVYSLIWVNMKLIHSLFAFFVVSCGFFFLWGWMREELKNTLGGLLVAMMFYFSFSAIFIVLPLNSQHLFNPEVSHEITSLPKFIDAKNRLGGSSNINEIFYLNHRAAAISGLMIFLFLIVKPIKFEDKWKFPLLALLTITVISTDEVVLPSIGCAGLYFFINQLIKTKKEERRQMIFYAVLSGFLFIALFFLIGNALRDSILIPAAVPRFHLVFTPDSIFLRLKELKSAILTLSGYNSLFYMPSLFITGILAVIFAYKIRNPVSTIFLISAIGTLLAFLFVEHTFYPGNQGRFLHLLYLLVITTLIFGLINLLFTNKGSMKFFVGFVIFYLCGVSVMSSTVAVLKQIKSANYPNYESKLPEFQPVFSWMQQHAPQSNIFFLDGYLKGVSYSHLSIAGIQDYGMFVPVSPASIKVHTPDFGVEALDLIMTLNPRDMNALKIEYLYIQNDQFINLNSERLQNLNNPDFFRKIYQDYYGVLYKVDQNYLNVGRNDDNVSIYGLVNLIGHNKKIYLDYPPGIEMGVRQVLWLALKSNNEIYTYWSSGIFNYIETPMTIYPPAETVEYDYVIVDSKMDPLTVCNCLEYLPIWRMTGVAVYKVIK